jgi:hypothetical protein
MAMLSLSITAKGETEQDLLLALEKIMQLIKEGFTSGFDRNESGKFIFDTVMDEPRQRPATAGNDQ